VSCVRDNIYKRAELISKHGVWLDLNSQSGEISSASSVKKITIENIISKNDYKLLIKLMSFGVLLPGEEVQTGQTMGGFSMIIRGSISCSIFLFLVEVTLGFKVKSGECKRVCCGAGGAVVMSQTCTPQNRCEGIGNSTKEEAGHCPGEEKNTCSDVKCKGRFYHLQLNVFVLNCNLGHLV